MSIEVLTSTNSTTLMLTGLVRMSIGNAKNVIICFGIKRIKVTRTRISHILSLGKTVDKYNKNAGAAIKTT
jgi:hypothetical protein